MIFPIEKPVLVLVGPTAIGKTSLSLTLAKRFNCEIVSLDSMQVYRYMDIGTAKATEEERQKIAHHLIDIVDPDEHYDAANYENDALEVINKIHSLGKLPLLTGGTGLYLKAVIEGIFAGETSNPELRSQLLDKLKRVGCSKLHEELSLIDPQSSEKIHENDTHRLIRALEIYYQTGLPWSEHIQKQAHLGPGKRFTKMFVIGLTCERELLYDRINKRTRIMLQSGLVEEVEKLLAQGYTQDLKPMQAIGYKHIIGHLLDNWTIEETERLLARDTRRFAKRQYTWFKKMDLQWFDVSNKDQIIVEIDQYIQK